MKEGESFLPFHIRQITDGLTFENELTTEEISKLLNTQTFIVERIIRVLNLSPTKENLSPLSRNIAQKLTRVLTSTIEVRSLVFFKILDDNNDQYVGKYELSRFYENYLNMLQSLDKSLIPLILQMLFKRFHLDIVGLFED